MAHDHAAATSIGDVAVIVNPADNVAVVKTAVDAGLVLERPDGHIVTLTGAVTPGHRFATRAIPEGTFVLQYGQPIGTSRGIAEGDPITLRNMSNEVPVVRDLPADLHIAPPDYFPASQVATWQGFRRPDGRIGTRNFVLIVPTSMCASHEALQVATIAEFTEYSRERFPNVDGVVAIPHNKGCGCPDGSNIDVLLRVLANYADHPNVGGVVLMELGCEKTNLSVVEDYLNRCSRKLSKPFVRIGVQDVGGTKNAIQSGLDAVSKMLAVVNESKREKVGIGELVLGVKCGASDAFSGISANPGLGRAADML